MTPHEAMAKVVDVTRGAHESHAISEDSFAALMRSALVLWSEEALLEVLPGSFRDWGAGRIVPQEKARLIFTAQIQSIIPDHPLRKGP